VKSMTVLKHLVGYLASHDSICMSLKWKGRTTGLFHGYSTSIPGERIMEIYTDSDWASDRTSRRSVSSATIFLGGCLLYSCSRRKSWFPFQVLKQKFTLVVKTRERRGSSFSQLGLEPNHTGLTAQSLFFLEESCRVKRSDTQTFSNFSNYFKRVLKLQERSSSFSK